MTTRPTFDSPADRSATPLSTPASTPAARPESDDDVRALLARLPDPGPMPDRVRERILHSLADAEHERRRGEELTRDLGLGGMGGTEGTEGTEGMEGMEQDEASGWPPAGLAAPRASWLSRRGRPRWPALLLGAAGIAGVAVGGTAVVHSLTSPLTDLSTVQAAIDTTGAVHLQASSTAYTSDGLATQARALLAAPVAEVTPSAAQTADAAAVSDGSPDSTTAALGAVGTRAGISGCLVALGEADATSASVDLATFDGQPAAIVVVSHTGEAMATAYAVERDCARADAHILQDATPVPPTP